MYEVHVGITTIVAALYFIQLLIILLLRFFRRLGGYDRPKASSVAGWAMIIMLVPQFSCSAFNWVTKGSNAALLWVSVAGIGTCVTFEAALHFLASKDPAIALGDCLMYDEVLKNETSLSPLYGDPYKPQLTRTEKACLEFCSNNDIFSTLEANDTAKNQYFWGDIAVLHRMRHVLGNCRVQYRDKLSLMCQCNAMSRAELFEFVVTRKRTLRRRLGFHVTHTRKPHGWWAKTWHAITRPFKLPVRNIDAEVQRQFNLIRDPNHKIQLL